MLTMITKYNSFVLMTLALVMVQSTNRIHAFTFPTSSSRITQGARIITSLQQKQNNDQERKDFFSTVKKFLGASVLVGVGGRKPLPVFAEETDTSPSGNVIEIKVNNLDGGGTGIVKIQMKPEWAPRGVARFEELVSSGFYDDCRFFRVLPGFISQFGINGDPKVMSKWTSLSIPDDPVKVSNSRNTVVFATSGPNTRTTQIFVNTRNQGNDFLDKQGFSPFGVVIEGMDIVDKLYAGYGEGAPSGKGPNQGLIQKKGNEYLTDKYPDLSYISKASIAK